MLRAAVLVATLLFLISGTACRRTGVDRTGAGPNAGSFDKPALLRAFSACTVGLYRDFDAAAIELAARTRIARDTPSADATKAAQDAWIRATDVWQEAEVTQFGPAAAPKASPGGQDLRNVIYAWPLVNRCLIEQQLVAETYRGPDLTTTLVSTRGLGAMEYLLFVPGPDNACGPTADINAKGQWAALGAAEIGRRRLAYASALADDLVVRSGALRKAWEPGPDSFSDEMPLAGRGGKVYLTDQMAFNAVSDGLFYVEEVKDLKLARPLGLADCGASPCLDLVESRWARRSKEHVRSNLLGFRRFMEGCGPGGTGLGLDDYLAAVGAHSVGERMRAETSSAVAAIEALGALSLEEAVTRDPKRARAVFDPIRRLVDLMKNEMLADLDLELPRKIKGEND